MNENSIKSTWDHIVANLPVEPQEIYDLVAQVANEFASAASTDGKAQLNKTTPWTKLPQGMAIELATEKHLITGVYAAQFDVTINRKNKEHVGVFLAQAGIGELHRDISDPDDTTALIAWTQADGPQKAWITNSLRTQAVNFITEAFG